MMISRSAFIVATVVGVSAGIGGLSLSVLIKHEGPAPVVQPQPRIIQPEIDENAIADRVAARLIAEQDARLTKEREKHRKADCAFWGKGMKGCS